MGQVEDTTWDHFNSIAGGYDDLYGFMYEYIAEFTIKHLHIKPEDGLIDIGAGTGSTASLIWKKAGLHHPVLCIDPAAEILKVAAKKPGVETCLATGDQFFVEYEPTHNECKYNKILISQTAHHFPSPQDTFQRAYNFLPQYGMMALVTHSNKSTLPMWKEFQEIFSPKSKYHFVEYLENAGFNVKCIVEFGKVKMTKGEWYDKMRKRMFSTLYQLSDEEIEAGLKELDEEWFPGKGDTDIIELTDRITLYIASKE